MNTIRLADGRRLAYAEYGDPEGRPLFYLHGYPGSRLEAGLLDITASSRRIRVIAPDRNGMGGSDDHPGRRLLDWPRDMELLADALDIERFRLIGVSGGCPYALACAYRSHHRIEALALVSPLGPLSQPSLRRAMPPPSRFAIESVRRVPRLSRLLFRHLLSPLARKRTDLIYRWLISHTDPADRRVLIRPEVSLTLQSSINESARQGTSGLIHELTLYLSPWGFELPDVTLPVQLWHGAADRIVPTLHGRYIAEGLADCDAVFLPGEGHYSLPIDQKERILHKLFDS